MDMSKPQFIRFTVLEKHVSSKQPKGLFAISYELLDSEELSPEDKNELKKCLEWFEENLPTPDHGYITDRYVFWYKIEAAESIRQMWRIANFLERCGYFVEEEKCYWPGAVIYQDDYQVAARPMKRKK